MMKHLFLYPWIMAALVLGICICLGMIARTLLFPPEAAIHIDAVLVWEGLKYALA